MKTAPLIPLSLPWPRQKPWLRNWHVYRIRCCGELRLQARLRQVSCFVRCDVCNTRHGEGLFEYVGSVVAFTKREALAAAVGGAQ